MQPEPIRQSGARYPRVVKLDVSIGSRNVGDEIIADAVERVIMEIAPDAHLIRLPTHLSLGLPGLKIVRKSRLTLVGGSNLLSSNMLRYNQWKINLLDSAILKNAVLLGVGWWQYQKCPDTYTRYLLKRVLSPTATHIVRDSYSAKMLHDLGMTNVRNLGCPTTWYINVPEIVAARNKRSDTVIATVTDYKPDVVRDNAMLAALRERYDKRYLWLQGSEDYRYITQQLDAKGFKLIPPTLASYDHALRQGGEYVGTRLHAGIRAMQHGRYARIVPVDNRAAEMGKDFQLPLLKFTSYTECSHALDARQPVTITLPNLEISTWKDEMRALL